MLIPWLPGDMQHFSRMLLEEIFIRSPRSSVIPKCWPISDVNFQAKKKEAWLGLQTWKKIIFLHILLVPHVPHLCAYHIQALIILCSLLLWLPWERGAAALCSGGIQELWNLAQRRFTPKREMTQGRKRITGVIKVVQFDNAEMKFCLVTSQGDKETEDHLRPSLPRIPEPWHLLKAEEAGGSAERGWSLSGHSRDFPLTQGSCQSNLCTEWFWGDISPLINLHFADGKNQGRDWSPSEGDSGTPAGQQSMRGFIELS